MISAIRRGAVPSFTSSQRCLATGLTCASKLPKKSLLKLSKHQIRQSLAKSRTFSTSTSVTKYSSEDEKLKVEEMQDHSLPPDGPRIVFSGIQPTGVPHFGNYIGALRQWKRYHEQSNDAKTSSGNVMEQYFSIVDLHALTASIPRADRLRLRKESYASLLSMGLRNTATTALFYQSDVSGVVLGCVPSQVDLLTANRYLTIAN